MDLNQVNSVQDLLSQNSTPTLSVVDQVKKLLVEEGNGKDNLPVIMFCMENLIRIHMEVSEHLISEGETETACAWRFDQAQLLSAMRILMDVNMDF